MSRKHTANVFRDLPDLMYGMLADVSSMKARLGEEIERMKATSLSAERAHHIMVLAIRGGALPASRLPKVLEYYGEMRPEEFGENTAWSLFNSFTAVTGQQPPWRQMECTLRLTQVFRKALPIK